MPAAITAEERERDRRSLLDAAETLMYGKGIQAVGMDEICRSSGLSLKRVYALYGSKDDLVAAMLRRRDIRWRSNLAAHVERVADPRERVLAVFDWLRVWFAEPGFRGCAWINAHGELGASSAAVLAEVRTHKSAFHDQLAGWVSAVRPAAVEGVYLLAEGAMVAAGISGTPDAAAEARRAAEVLLSTRS
ncbi:TetR/AcrR family transcriptional regulator [Nocardia alni]|uniref:TetR/AcrR family transcriptional regulator n=1 Tax=Nocardia alni TaxID=2815723 RepID=UPI001C21DA77|nr:TetR/AcrR family transcriptional regulator [Nocardia alni]